MPIEMPISQARANESDMPRTAIVAFIGIGLGSAALAAWLLPLPLVLPVLSIGAVLAAVGVATVALRRPKNLAAARVTYWDMAGALTLIGICAALLSDPEAVIPILESRPSR